MPGNHEVLDAYLQTQAGAWPWPGQRTVIATINRWREQGSIMLSDVGEVACNLDGLNPETDDLSNTPIPRYERVVRAQRYAWAQLATLAKGQMPKAPASPFDLDFDNTEHAWGAEQKCATQDWMHTTLACLDTQESGLRIRAIFGELPPDLKDTLGREFAQDILETPYLLGNLLYWVVSRFWPGFGGPSTILVYLAGKWSEAAQAGPKWSRHFWQCVLQGFLYAAAHPQHDQSALAHQLDQHHPDSVATVVASLKSWAATPRTGAWTPCPGPGEGLNSSIAYSNPAQLLESLFG